MASTKFAARRKCVDNRPRFAPAVRIHCAICHGICCDFAMPHNCFRHAAFAVAPRPLPHRRLSHLVTVRASPRGRRRMLELAPSGIPKNIEQPPAAASQLRTKFAARRKCVDNRPRFASAEQRGYLSQNVVVKPALSTKYFPCVTCGRQAAAPKGPSVFGFWSVLTFGARRKQGCDEKRGFGNG